MNLNAEPGEAGGKRRSTADSNATPADLAALALQLHESDSPQLEIEVPADFAVDLIGVQGVTVVDSKLRFATLVDRNRIVAAASYQALGERALEVSPLFAAAARLWRHEIGHDDMASARLLALVHARSDVLAMAVQEIATASNVFRLLNMLGKLLPLLDRLDWAALIAVSAAQYPRTKGDGAAGVFFGQVRQWLVAHPGSGAELSALLLRQPSEPMANLLVAAWLAWSADAAATSALRVVELAACSEEPLRAVTGRVAENMLEDAELPQDALAPLEELVQEWLAGRTPESRRRGVAAATSVFHFRHSFDAALRSMAEAKDPDTLGYVAVALSRHAKVFLEAGTFFDWLALCVHLPTSHAGAVRYLDSTLGQLLGPQSSHRDAVLQFLQTWITAQPMGERIGREFPELFNSCAIRIVEDQALLPRVVTTWFMADARAMPEAAASLIAGLSSEGRVHRRKEVPISVGFDPALLDGAATADFLFLARRLIGYVINADLLLSLALSLLRVRDAKSRVHPLMASLLNDEIGYDYPVTTAGRLAAMNVSESDADTRALLEGIHADIQRYLAQLDALPRLRELGVPLTLQRAFRKARAQQMAHGMREARKKSVFAQIATEVHLKAGLSSFQYLHEDFTAPMALQSLSYSVEMPRRESLDPVGNAYRLHMHRSAKREPS